MTKNHDHLVIKIYFLKKMFERNIFSELEYDDITEIMVNTDGSIWFKFRMKSIFHDFVIGEFKEQNILLKRASLKHLFLNFKNKYTKISLLFNRECLKKIIASNNVNFLFLGKE